MIDHNDPLYACQGKQAFGSWVEGDRAITRIRKFDSRTAPVHLYRCPYCPSWHIGSKKGRSRK